MTGPRNKKNKSIGRNADGGRPTIYDVSRLSGFSTATVSRVFSNYPRISQSTRSRVMAVSRKLGFSPSHIGRALARGNTRIIAVMFPVIASGFFAEALAGIDEVLAEDNFTMLTAFYGRGRDIQSVLTRLTSGYQSDALILASTYDLGNNIQFPSVRQTPMVLLDRPIPGADSGTILIDNIAGVSAMVRHLAENGHRRIAVISGPENTWDAQQRIQGYFNAMKELNLPVDPSLIWRGDFALESGRQAMRKAIATRASFDAVFCLNDEMALGAIAAIHEAGLRIPDDIAIAGFDGISAAESLQLTTVICPMRDLGRAAATVAISLTKGETNPPDQLIPVQLIVRRSSGRKMVQMAEVP
ncbi:MAG: LacI family DNA-binding transcriptional regulator [Phycisphaerae bacterium]